MTHHSVLSRLLFIASAAVPFTASAEQLFQQSGSVPQLIELYTSEGCSSCPPADKNLQRLLNDPELWERRLPVAFHVDYWDYIGWKDPYAKSEFTERQYKLKKAGAIDSIYTPEWVIDGKEWRGFFLGQSLPTPPSRQGGNLIVKVNKDQQVKVTYQDNLNTTGKITAHLVLLSFSQKSNVTAGENKGKELQHDFVAFQQMTSINPIPEWSFTLPDVDQSSPTAMVVWLTTRNSPQPLQATGGWLE